jgi:hypothetical protein
MRSLAAHLTPAERDMMACLGDMLKTADAVTVSRRKVALIVDATMFDRFNELVDIATFDDREADAGDEPELLQTEEDTGSDELDLPFCGFAPFDGIDQTAGYREAIG